VRVSSVMVIRNPKPVTVSTAFSDCSNDDWLTHSEFCNIRFPGVLGSLGGSWRLYLEGIGKANKDADDGDDGIDV
jgi:hypothetical protein